MLVIPKMCETEKIGNSVTVSQADLKIARNENIDKQLLVTFRVRINLIYQKLSTFIMYLLFNYLYCELYTALECKNPFPICSAIIIPLIRHSAYMARINERSPFHARLYVGAESCSNHDHRHGTYAWNI